LTLLSQNTEVRHELLRPGIAFVPIEARMSMTNCPEI